MISSKLIVIPPALSGKVVTKPHCDCSPLPLSCSAPDRVTLPTIVAKLCMDVEERSVRLLSCSL